MKYVLHYDVNMRKDGDRVILYVINPVESELSDFVMSIDTRLSLFLALQDGSTELKETIKVWGKLVYGISNIDCAIRELKKYLSRSFDPQQKIREILVPSGSEERRDLPNPTGLIIDKQKLTLSQPRLKVPLRMLFIPTFICSQRCYYCYSGEENGKGINLLPFTRVREIFAEAKNLGMTTIDLSGGEIFTYSHIYELLEYFQTLGLRVNIPTKHPLSRNQIRRLRRSSITSLQFSIDAITPSILDNVVGIDGYSSKVTETFRYFEEEDLRVRVNIVVTPFNANDVPNLIKFLASHRNIYMIHLSPYAKSRFRHKEEYNISPNSFSKLESEVRSILKKRPDIRFFPGEVMPDYLSLPPNLKKELWLKRSLCTGGRHSFILLPDGKVTICEELYYHSHYLIGDLSVQSIMEMWDSSKAQQVVSPSRQDIPGGPCRDCDEFDECHKNLGRCAREAIKVYGVEKHYYPDPKCPKAPNLDD